MANPKNYNNSKCFLQAKSVHTRGAPDIPGKKAQDLEPTGNDPLLDLVLLKNLKSRPAGKRYDTAANVTPGSPKDIEDANKWWNANVPADERIKIIQDFWKTMFIDTGPLKVDGL